MIRLLLDINQLAEAVAAAIKLGYEEQGAGANMPASTAEVVQELRIANWLGGNSANSSEALRALRAAYMAGWRLSEHDQEEDHGKL